MSLLKMSFSGAVFIIAVVVVRALAINKIPKKTFLILWEIAFLRLLVPFSIPFKFSIYTLINQMLSTFTFFGTDTNNSVSDLSQEQIIMAQGIEKLSSNNHLSFDSIWFTIWCMGVIFFALFFSVSYLRCQMEFQTSLPVYNDYVEQWLKERPIKRSISVRQLDRILTPLTYGIFHPVILMPKKTDWEDTKQLLYVLSHEYVHIYRYDIVKKLMAVVVLCIHWFNPMVWVMYILFNRDIELACDESVMRQFCEKSKSDYSLMLISMEAKKKDIMPFCNSFGRNAIEERITAIMKAKKITTFSLIVACLIVGGTTTAFATSAQLESSISSLGDPELEFFAPNMQPYGDGSNYFFLSEDYVVDGNTIYKAGYYEAIKLIDGSEFSIFVPINPTSFERLPSDHFSDGTVMEIEGNNYEIHINNNQYTAILKEQKIDDETIN